MLGVIALRLISFQKLSAGRFCKGEALLEIIQDGLSFYIVRQMIHFQRTIYRLVAHTQRTLTRKSPSPVR